MQDVRSPTAVRSTVRRVTLTSLAVNLLLSAMKFATGLFGGSQTMIADAAHSLSDASTDIAILLGVNFWSAPPDRGHPYGHWRIETLVSSAIGLILITFAVGISAKSFQNIRIGATLTPAWFTLVVPLISVIAKEVLFRRTISTGRAIFSSALVANAWHHRSDALSSIPAIIAIIVARMRPEWAYFDQIGAILVSGFIFFAAIGIFKNAVKDLLDAGASEAILNTIRSVAENIDGVSSVHAIRTRKVGPGYHLDLHVLVPSALTVRQGHDVAEKVRTKLLRQGGAIRDVLVHIEPDDDSVGNPG